MRAIYWVEYSDDANLEEGKKLIEALGGRIEATYSHIRYWYVVFDGELMEDGGILRSLEKSKIFRNVRRDGELFLFGMDDKEAELNESGIIPPEEYLKMTEAEELKQLGYMGESVKVGVLDSGVDVSKFDKNVIPISKDVEDRIGHGTAVVDIITTIAPKATVYVAKVTDSKGRVDSKKALDWMEEMGKRGVDVLNISFGGEEEDDGNFPLTKEAEYLVSKGMNVVCAIGNKRTGIISYPASGGNVISVGSIDGKGKPSYFSNYGRTFDGRKKPEVVSYGEDIVVKKSRKGRLGFSLDEDYTLVSGTSFACPMVAGIVALLRGCMNNEKKVRSSIFETAEKPESLILNGLAFVEDMFVGIMRMLGINVGLFAGEVVSGADAYGRYGIVRAAKAMSFLSGREINKFIKGYGKLLRRHTGVGG